MRLGVAAFLAASLAIGWLRIVPMIERERSLLRDLSERKFQTIRLGSKLQYDIEECRRKSLRILVSSIGDPAAYPREIGWIHETDATVLRTQARIERLGAESPARQEEFHRNWLRYVAQRDEILQGASAHMKFPLTDEQTDPAAQTFWPLEKGLQQTELEIEADANGEIGRVSDSLHRALNEFLLSTAVKVVALALLLWVDWKRIRTEKQLDRANRSLTASEERFRQAYESAAVGMFMIGLDGTVISANPKGVQILGYEREELIGRKAEEFMAPESAEDHRRTIATLPESGGNSYQAERRILRKDGSEAWIRNSVTLLRPEGQEPHYFSITEEITLERQANDRLNYLANYDPVTNLANRYYFEQQLAEALRQAAGSGKGAALLYAEIDSFDFLKGTFGRNAADEVLSELAASLTAFRQTGEVVGRLDDHVFAILMRAVPYDAASLDRAAQLRALFHRFSESGNHRIPLSASIGIAYSEVGQTSPEDREGGSSHVAPQTQRHSRSATRNGDASATLLQYGRAAMLEARFRGGDSIFVADPSLQERAAQRHRIESALLAGLRLDEFRVVFQPQFEVATGKLVRFEALCRWNSAELGPISPDCFIPIAEQTGLIAEIGRRVMRDALSQAKIWAQSGRRIGVAVNISPMQFLRPDFTRAIAKVLETSGFPPELLELEITEGIFIRDLNLAVARIHELQRLGLSIALDDFGTGFSSLSYLQRMPIDAIKLDRSFVGEMTKDAASVSLVRSVMSIAEALSLRVVSEGVETEAQLQILRSLGCDEAQGYLLGCPEPPEMALRRVMESPLQTVGTRDAQSPFSRVVRISR